MTSLQPKGRLASLDALRGFDMLFIAGLAYLIRAVCCLFPGGESCWLEAQMHHAAWDGLTHHDTIFPLFIFIAGVSFPYSYAKQLSVGKTKCQIYLKVFNRAAILVFLGMVCNGLLKLESGPHRFFSVLERIGVAGMLASILYMNFKPCGRIIIAALILAVYGAVSFIVAPDAPAGISPHCVEGNIAAYIDRTLFAGRIYKEGVYEPEGLLSTFPAVVTAMFGNFTGEFIRNSKLNGNKKCLYMAGAAAIMVVAGLVWSHWLPLNKKLWSSSFTLVVGGYSVAMLALFYWIIDIKGYQKWAFPLKVFGMNSIAIFLIPKFIDLKYTVNFFFGGLCRIVGDGWDKVFFWSAYLLLVYLILYVMYKKDIFIKV